MPLSANLFRLESSILTRAKRATNRNNVATEKRRDLEGKSPAGKIPSGEKTGGEKTLGNDLGEKTGGENT